MNRLFRRFVSYALVFSIAGLPGAAQAGMIGTDELVEPAQVHAGRATLRDFMARADVQDQLQQHGVTRDAAQARADALSDADVQHLAGKINSLPAGATTGEAGVVGVVVLLVAITYIIVRAFYPQK